MFSFVRKTQENLKTMDTQPTYSAILHKIEAKRAAIRVRRPAAAAGIIAEKPRPSDKIAAMLPIATAAEGGRHVRGFHHNRDRDLVLRFWGRSHSSAAW